MPQDNSGQAGPCEAPHDELSFATDVVSAGPPRHYHPKAGKQERSRFGDRAAPGKSVAERAFREERQARHYRQTKDPQNEHENRQESRDAD